jgi:outer membrane biosynthesis protein TonB
MQRPWAIITAAFVLNVAACAQRAPAPRASPTSQPAAASTPVRVALGTPAPHATLKPTPAPSQTPTVAPSQTPPPSPSPTRLQTPTPAPSQTPTPPPSQTPSPQPSQDLVTPAPDAPPRIVAVHIDNQTVHSGETVSGMVETSSNVATVEARIAAFSIAVPKVGVGRFALSYRVPFVPFFFYGTYPMTVVARNTAGVAVERVIPITVR